MLNGEIRDLNLYTLSRDLTQSGLTVVQALIVRDIPQQIIDSLHFLLASAPDVMLCSGGLGPTEDDLTLQALAQALNRPLRANAAAREMVEAQYDHLMVQGYLEQRGPEAARAKMALLPEGAEPLPNPVGTAPGVRLEVANTILYVLPGVPAELEAIVAGSVMPELRQRFELRAWVERAIRVHVEDEAEVAAPLREVQRRHSDVYLKSLAQPFPVAGREGLRIIAATYAVDVARATETVEAALADLYTVLVRAGLSVSRDSDDVPA